MKIDGVSQSTGDERVIELSREERGESLLFSNKSWMPERIVVSPEALVTILTDRPEGPQSVMGFTGGEPREMKAEVRRNEVWLALGRMDAAVGLDDLMDGLSEFLA
jgi:hypothetical protein